MIDIISDISAVRDWISRRRAAGETIGCVPTMGALHEGHLRLVDIARAHADTVVVSIYVNPTQFGPGEDFDRYPRDLEKDRDNLEKRGCGLVFAPSDPLMYPDGYATYVTVERLTEGLCGTSRPGHFRGVTTIVTKLLNIIQPDCAVFGRKDAQQLAVIRKMVRDLNLPVTVIPGDTVREEDGLAMSSRNAYLSSREREQAAGLYRALVAARRLVKRGTLDGDRIIGVVRDELSKYPLMDIEYISLVDPEELETVDRVEKEALLACAVKVGETRLIDNIIVSP